MKKVKGCLYIGPYAENDFGGGLGINKNKKMLESIFRDNFTKIEFETEMPLLRKLLCTLRGYTLGLNARLCRETLNRIRQKPPEYILIDGSAYGKICKRIKKRYPRIQIVTFFHNVECKYVYAVLKKKKKLGNLLTWLATYYSERLAIQYSDTIIALNERDNRQLATIYRRKADHLLPVSFEDRFDPSRLNDNPHSRLKGLFIGSLFYANYHGIKWFVQHVAPFINADIDIVGKNFETVRNELETSPNVHVIGSVTDMAEYIYNADFLIAPIFEGSGMKLKTAEALMYGKTVFGTTEAFEGYEVDYERVGGLCNTAEEFIDKINGIKGSAIRYNSYCREKKKKKYSNEVSARTFRSFFKI